MELGSRTGDRGQRSEVRGRPDGEKAGSAEGHPLAPDRAVRRRSENSVVRKRSGGKERSVQDPPQPVPWVKGQSMAAPQGNSITRSQRRPGDPSALSSRRGPGARLLHEGAISPGDQETPRM